MSNKYAVASNTTAGDRTLNNAQAIIQLSSGAVVFLAVDPSAPAANQLKLYVSSDHVTVTTIGTVTVGSAGYFYLPGLPNAIALCRDASDNLYVIGSGYTWGGLVEQTFTKKSGLNWTPQPVMRISAIATSIDVISCAAVWCATGGGERGSGHVMAIYQDTAGATYAGTLDAGDLLDGDSSALANEVSAPAFLGGNTTAALAGSNFDISSDGFGATNGLAIQSTSSTSATVGAWGVSSSGVITTSSGFHTTLTTGTVSTSTKVRMVRYAAGLWAVLTPSPNTAGRITCSVYNATALLGAVDSGNTSPFPTNLGSSRSWDAIAAPVASLQVYLLGWSSATATTMESSVFTMNTPAAPSWGSVATADTAVGAGTPTSIRTVKEPVATLFADYQGYSSVTPFALVGDYSALLATPYSPTLISPAVGDIAAIGGGGVFIWAFSSSAFGDAQTVYYFRRQLIGGAYQWWDGAAWQASSTPVTSSAQGVTFPTGQWAYGTTYNWSVATTGSTGLIGPYAADQQLTVANLPPAAPTLTVAYNAGPNTTTLTLHSTDATGTTGSIEFSDDGGTTWAFVRYAAALVVYPGTATVTDLEAPPQPSTRMYRAQTWTAAPQSFSPYATGSVSPILASYWLRDPVTGTSMQIWIKAGSYHTTIRKDATLHYGLGRQYAVAVVGDVHGREGSMTLLSSNETEEAALESLLAANTVLHLQRPNGGASYLFVTVDAAADTTMMVTKSSSYREHVVSFVETERPS